MLHTCSYAGCETLTLGEFCVEHDAPVRKMFTRGRPYPPRPQHVRADTRELAGDSA